MKALVLYHSLYGNTKSVAMSLTRGIEKAGVKTICRSIDEFDIKSVTDFDFIAIGGPTHILKTSKQMSAFLEDLLVFNLKGVSGFSFDTRNESRMNRQGLFVLENSAARVIEGRMKRLKMKIIRSRESAIVHGREGPLDSGVEKRFFEIGREIGITLRNTEFPAFIKSKN
ncbi:MAG: flavodoxin domain-containing protein [Candidatus Thorarchaeota archaeon]